MEDGSECGWEGWMVNAEVDEAIVVAKRATDGRKNFIIFLLIDRFGVAGSRS